VKNSYSLLFLFFEIFLLNRNAISFFFVPGPNCHTHRLSLLGLANKHINLLTRTFGQAAAFPVFPPRLPRFIHGLFSAFRLPFCLCSYFEVWQNEYVNCVGELITTNTPLHVGKAKEDSPVSSFTQKKKTKKNDCVRVLL